MLSLGIDPSLTGFGWCIHNPTVTGPGRVISRGVFTTSSKDLFFSRYAKMRRWLIQLLDAYPDVKSVGVESPPFGELWSEGLYALFVYVNEALYLSRRDVVYFDPKTLKMLAKMDPSVRKGTMDKLDMVEAARAETGIKKWNHNEADAYIIARSAARFWQFESLVITDDELTPSERQSFARVHTFKRGKKAGLTERRGLIHREDDRFHRFSIIPIDPEEEELRWLLKRNSKLNLKEL